ncbi:hypothetical protein ACI2KR_06605 [Pseudomonas luteola]
MLKHKTFHCHDQAGAFNKALEHANTWLETARVKVINVETLQKPRTDDGSYQFREVGVRIWYEAERPSLEVNTSS